MKNIRKCLSIFLAIITIFTTLSVSMSTFATEKLIETESIKDEMSAQGKMTSKIVREADELRGEYEKHFVCEDGSYMVATYSQPVHYKENGEWKEINNSLELSADVKSDSGKAMYTTKAGSVDVKIPQNFSNGQKVSATNKGYTISFGANQDKKVCSDKHNAVIKNVEELSSGRLAERVAAITVSAAGENKIATYNDEAMAVKNQSGAIVYEDVFDNAELEYIVTSNSIKENIVVNEKQDEYEYSFNMNFGELIPVVNVDNSISVVNPKDMEETVFYIEAPYMYDSKGVESTDVEMSLVKNDEIYVLTLQANAEWINASVRELPVVIDPTIYLSLDDVFVMDGLTNKNTTKINNELRVGRNLVNLTRTYIKPTLPTNIPEGSYIESAYLDLVQSYYYKAPLANDVSIRAIDCYDVDSWNATNVTWENQPYDKSNNGYGSGYNYLSSVSAKSSQSVYSFNITQAVRRWINGGVNNGIMLASSDETQKVQVDFHSSRASNSNNHPTMYFTYTLPYISISSWETDSMPKVSPAFQIVTGSSWSAYSDSEWIGLETTSGTGAGSSRIVVDLNESVEGRTGTVTVKIGDMVIGIIAVTQYGAEPLLWSEVSELDFYVCGGRESFWVDSNTTWTFENIPDWVTVTPSEGSMSVLVEVEVSENLNNVERDCDLVVTTMGLSETIHITQSCDDEAPSAPNLYEEDGLVYMSTHSINFNEEWDTAEHIEYKIGNGEWLDYNGGPLDIVRTYDVTVYARTCDAAGNISTESSLLLECDLGEYTISYTDIELGENTLPVGFERTYSSNTGWFFTFEANLEWSRNGYVFTDFYGDKQYFFINSDGEYMSASGEKLEVREGTLRETSYSYVVQWGDLECFFNDSGKLAVVRDAYDTVTYSWANNNIYITDEAGNTNIVRLSNDKPVSISASRFDSATNSTISKNVQYQWIGSSLTKFIDVSNIEHNYAYTNGRLTTNEDETIVYSDNGRVKKITQLNGDYIKYTYNDVASSSDSQTPDYIGAVVVSDSEGYTDIWYYADGFTITNALYDYSDNVIYDPDNISEEITTDTLSQIVYIKNI